MHRRLIVTVALTALLAIAGCSGSDQPEAAPAPTPARATGSPTGEPTRYDQYVALGDSYTAAPLVPPTDFSTTCLRSGVNYPALLAKAMPGTALTDVSCSGASTRDTTSPQGGGSNGVPPQFDALHRTTDLVTIGLGGNDDNLFTGVLGRCVQVASTEPAGSPCQDSFASRGGGRLAATFTDITDRVARVVQGVRERSPHARILVVGYPQIIPAHGTCRLLPLASGDYDFARGVNERLTDAVRDAAHRAHAEYVDLWAASAGHDVCGAHPWINGRVTTPGRALAYHPLAVEQEHVARLILGMLQRS